MREDLGAFYRTGPDAFGLTAWRTPADGSEVESAVVIFDEPGVAALGGLVTSADPSIDYAVADWSLVPGDTVDFTDDAGTDRSFEVREILPEDDGKTARATLRETTA